MIRRPPWQTLSLVAAVLIIGYGCILIGSILYWMIR